MNVESGNGYVVTEADYRIGILTGTIPPPLPKSLQPPYKKKQESFSDSNLKEFNIGFWRRLGELSAENAPRNRGVDPSIMNNLIQGVNIDKVRAAATPTPKADGASDVQVPTHSEADVVKQSPLSYSQLLELESERREAERKRWEECQKSLEPKDMESLIESYRQVAAFSEILNNRVIPKASEVKTHTGASTNITAGNTERTTGGNGGHAMEATEIKDQKMSEGNIEMNNKKRAQMSEDREAATAPAVHTNQEKNESKSS